jgi:hypothetical protein
VSKESRIDPRLLAPDEKTATLVDTSWPRAASAIAALSAVVMSLSGSVLRSGDGARPIALTGDGLACGDVVGEDWHVSIVAVRPDRGSPSRNVWARRERQPAPLQALHSGKRSSPQKSRQALTHCTGGRPGDKLRLVAVEGQDGSVNFFEIEELLG